MSNPFDLVEVQVALTPIQRFEEFLQSRGKRITQQQRALVEHVFSRHEHFDADDLIQDLRNADSGTVVSRPTVYRGLAKLVEAGLLRKMSLNGRAVYEHDYGYPQHDHLHCQKCNKLIEFQSDQLNQLRDAVARTHNFRVTGHRFIVTGICESCRRGARPTRPLDLI